MSVIPATWEIKAEGLLEFPQFMTSLGNMAIPVSKKKKKKESNGIN
jgi:hypothetical protein